MKNILIFDTETTSLEKPFCYNIGYVIADTDTHSIIEKKDFVIEQVWHNNMLFSTAYYSEKRPLYVNSMRARKTEMKKYGYVCQEMARDIKKYDIKIAFAFNSSFDEKVFNFNCDWFKCINPFDNVEIKDIRGYAHEFLIDTKYKEFCDTHEKYTESGNYSTTAETLTQYITNNPNFTEEHTALSDSIIEWIILDTCIKKGASIENNYKAKRSIPRNTNKELIIKLDNETILIIDCKNYVVKKSINTIYCKSGF